MEIRTLFLNIRALSLDIRSLLLEIRSLFLDIRSLFLETASLLTLVRTSGPHVIALRLCRQMGVLASILKSIVNFLYSSNFTQLTDYTCAAVVRWASCIHPQKSSLSWLLWSKSRRALTLEFFFGVFFNVYGLNLVGE